MKNSPEEINLLFVSYGNISFKAEIGAEELNIDWGDKEISKHTEQSFFSVTHDFPSEGLYNIKITGKHITSLNVSRLSLTELSFLNCSSLEFLDCSINELDRLDLTHCPTLEELQCNSNNLIELNLSNNPNLQHANISYNLLHSLDLSGCKSLNTLLCHNNHLAILYLNNVPGLQFLDLGNNLFDKDKLDQIFHHLPRTEAHAMICFNQNPGMDHCDIHILKTKNWKK